MQCDDSLPTSPELGKFPLIRHQTKRIMSVFGSTYICEKTFCPLTLDQNDWQPSLRCPSHLNHNVLLTCQLSFRAKRGIIAPNERNGTTRFKYPHPLFLFWSLPSYRTMTGGHQNKKPHIKRLNTNVFVDIGVFGFWLPFGVVFFSYWMPRNVVQVSPEQGQIILAIPRILKTLTFHHVHLVHYFGVRLNPFFADFSFNSSF